MPFAPPALMTAAPLTDPVQIDPMTGQPVNPNLMPPPVQPSPFQPPPLVVGPPTPAPVAALPDVPPPPTPTPDPAARGSSFAPPPQRDTWASTPPTPPLPTPEPMPAPTPDVPPVQPIVSPPAPTPTPLPPQQQPISTRPLPVALPTPAPVVNPGTDPLRDYARSVALKNGIDPAIFERQIDQESGFNPKAGSSAGARGIAQIVPKYHPGVNVDDPYASLDYAAGLMRQYLDEYHGDWQRALVRYNGGGGAVAAYESGHPYQESQLYLSRILGAANGGNTSAHYQVMSAQQPISTAPPVETPPPPPSAPPAPATPQDDGIPPWARNLDLTPPVGAPEQLPVMGAPAPPEFTGALGAVAGGILGSPAGPAGVVAGAMTGYQVGSQLPNLQPPQPNFDANGRSPVPQPGESMQDQALFFPQDPSQIGTALGRLGNALAVPGLPHVPGALQDAEAGAQTAAERLTGVDPATGLRYATAGEGPNPAGMLGGASDAAKAATQRIDPATAAGNERGLITSLRESPLNSPVLQKLLDDDPITYQPITNEATMAAAVDRVNTDAAAARARVVDPTGVPDVNELADGLVLLRRAAANNDAAEVRDLGKALAERWTKAGQAVQLGSVLDKMSPEGIFVRANKLVTQAIDEGKGTEVAQRMQKQANAIRTEKELAPLRQALADAQAAAEKAAAQAADWRQLAQAKQVEAATGKIAAHDLEAEIRGMFGEGQIYAPAAAARSETLQMSIGIPFRDAADKAVMLTTEQAAEFRAEAQRILGLPEAEQAAAKAALYGHMQDLKAGIVTPATAAPAAPASAPRQAGQQRANDLAFLIDETARKAPRVTPVDRIAVMQTKTLLRRTGATLPEDVANQFLDRAKALTDLSPDLQKPALRDLMNDIRTTEPVRTKLGALQATAPERAAATRLATQQANDLYRMIDTSARDTTARLTSVDRQAIQQAQGILSKTGVTLPEAQARDWLARAQALKSLVDEVRQYDPVQQALGKQQAASAADALAKRQAADLANLIDASTRKDSVVPLQSRMAIQQVKTLLTRSDVELPPEKASDFLARARQLDTLPEAERQAARSALVDEIKQYDPVKLATDQRAAVQEASRLLRQRAKDLESLTTQAVTAAQTRLKTAERVAVQSAKTRLKNAGITMPEELAQDFLDRANALKGMPEQEQFWAAKSLMGDVQRLIPPSKVDQFMSLYGLPRALKATWDLSYPLRQGIVLGAGHPKEWLDMFRENIRAFGSEEVAKAADNAVLFSPLSKARLEAGVDWVDRFGNLAQTEETYMTKLAGKIPLVENSERAYVVAGNKLRADVWDNVVRGWLPDEAKGQTFNNLADLAAASGHDVTDFTRLANWMNVTTGRGNLPAWMKSNNQFFNALFFAPKFTVSRFQVPYYAIVETMRTPAMRAEVARDLVGFVGVNTMVLALAKAAGADVETDPRSSDFGKIKAGPLRVEFWGGFQPLARYTAQMLTGQRKEASGRMTDVNRMDLLMDYFRTKLNPTVSEGTDLLSGKDMVGNRLDQPQPTNGMEQQIRQQLGVPTTQSVPEVALRRVASDYIPFLPTDILNAYQETGSLGAAGAAAVVSTFGGSVNAYSGMRDLQDQQARAMFGGLAYSDLTRSQREQVDASAPVKAKAAQAEASQQFDQHQVSAQARQQMDESTTALEAQLRKEIEGGLTGKGLNDAIKEFNIRRNQASQTAYSPMVQEMQAKGAPPQEMKDVLRAAYWSAQPPETVTPNGVQLDFAAQEQARADVLRQAKDAGISEAYITDRGTRWQDPVVAQAMEAREKDMATLKPYFAMGDTLQQQTRAYGEIVKQVQSLPAGSPQQKQAMLDTTYRLYERDLQAARDALRRRDPNVEAAGQQWGYFGDQKPVQDNGRPVRPTERPLRPLRPLRPGQLSPEAQAALSGAGGR